MTPSWAVAIPCCSGFARQKGSVGHLILPGGALATRSKPVQSSRYIGGMDRLDRFRNLSCPIRGAERKDTWTGRKWRLTLMTIEAVTAITIRFGDQLHRLKPGETVDLPSDKACLLLEGAPNKVRLVEGESAIHPGGVVTAS